MLKDGITAIQMIPVAILSDFLGAGKSTHINGPAADSMMKQTTILVNEFSNVRIDYATSRFIQSKKRRNLS
jgi:G3E family GTPase